MLRCAAGGEDTATLVWLIRRILLTIPYLQIAITTSRCCHISLHCVVRLLVKDSNSEVNIEDVTVTACMTTVHTISSWTTAWLALAPVASSNHDIEYSAAVE